MLVVTTLTLFNLGHLSCACQYEWSCCSNQLRVMRAYNGSRDLTYHHMWSSFCYTFCKQKVSTQWKFTEYYSCLHHNNAWPHTGTHACAHVHTHDCVTTILLGSFNFHLFSHLNKHLTDRMFDNDDEVMTSFNELVVDFYSSEIQKLIPDLISVWTLVVWLCGKVGTCVSKSFWAQVLLLYISLTFVIVSLLSRHALYLISLAL